MSQEFHVLRCFSCETFQVHIVKKSSNKWQCKMCGEKQSVKQVFGRGMGKDCRLHVQKLNNLRRQKAECKHLVTTENEDGLPICEFRDEETMRVAPLCDSLVDQGNAMQSLQTGSKWSKFLCGDSVPSNTGDFETVIPSPENVCRK